MKSDTKDHKQDKFGEVAKRVAGASGTPATFITAVAIIIIWAVTGPLFQFNDTWQLVINTGTTIITFLMVFLIQNTQNRDAAAVQLKLDEIIIALENADNSAVQLEDKTQEELEQAKSQYFEMAEKAGEEIEEKTEQLDECEKKLDHVKQNRAIQPEKVSADMDTQDRKAS